jgi:hypothetical protein
VIPVRYELNLVVVTLCDFCAVRTESRFHFVVVTLCDSYEVRTESRFHFVVVTICHSCEVKLKLKLIEDRQAVGQSVLVSGTHLGPATNFFSPRNFF